ISSSKTAITYKKDNSFSTMHCTRTFTQDYGLDYNGTQRLLSSSMLLATDRNNQILEQGSKKEFIQVFLLDKEQYDKIWKDKEFKIEVNLRTKEGKTMGAGKELSFDLPK
ncbi:hypothetical protein CKN73_09225, partial [Carnobacterium divergens]